MGPQQEALALLIIRDLFFEHIDFEVDADLGANGHVIADAEIAAVDGSCGRNAATGGIHRCDWRGRAGYVESHFLGDAVDDQISRHFGGAVAGLHDFGGLEAHHRIFRDIEEIGC